jgi:hypothetical protein
MGMASPLAKSLVPRRPCVTIAILCFWLYLAILAAIIVASLLALDPGLLRERMRPCGQRPPLGLRLFTIVMFLHWIVALDRGRFHWSDGVPCSWPSSSFWRRCRCLPPPKN